MALDSTTRKSFDGTTLPLDLTDGDQVKWHASRPEPFTMEFVEWTGEVALPREGGAVARVASDSGMTWTVLASELSR